MEKYFCFLFVIFLLKVNLYSQNTSPSVIASGGIYAETGPVKVSSTIGEPVIQTFYTINNIISQGFQQPHFNITLISDINSNLSFNLFPNPISHNILNISSSSNDTFFITIYDISGKKILHKPFNKFTLINFEPYAPGNYLLSITSNDNKPLKHFKVVKL